MKGVTISALDMAQLVARISKRNGVEGIVALRTALKTIATDKTLTLEQVRKIAEDAINKY